MKFHNWNSRRLPSFSFAGFALAFLRSTRVKKRGEEMPQADCKSNVNKFPQRSGFCCANPFQSHKRLRKGRNFGCWFKRQFFLAARVAAFAIQMGSRGPVVRAYVRGRLGKGGSAKTLLFPSVLLPILSDHILPLCKRRNSCLINFSVKS